jgi:O-antigen/teichoic acid export membrane protein
MAAAAGFGTVVLCSHMLGADGRGTLSVMLAYVQLIMIGSEFVGGSTLVNLTPRFGIRRLLPTAYGWLFLVWCGSWLWMLHSGKVAYLPALVMAAPLGLLTIHYSLLQGLGNMRRRNQAQLLYELLKLTGVGICLWVFTRYESLYVVVWSFALAAALAWLFTLPALRQTSEGSGESLLPPPDLFTAGWWSQWGHLVQFFNYRASIFIIDYFLGSNATGLYSNALIIADAVWIFGNSLGSVAHMRMVLRPDAGYARNLLRRYHSLSAAGTLLAVLVLCLLPNSVYVALFGHDFRSFRSVLLPLLPVILFLSLSTIPSHLLHAKNDFKALLMANLIACLVQVLLALVLVPYYGLMGAALSACIGFGLLVGLVWYRLNQKHGIPWPDAVPMLRYVLRFAGKVLHSLRKSVKVKYGWTLNSCE